MEKVASWFKLLRLYTLEDSRSSWNVKRLIIVPSSKSAVCWLAIGDDLLFSWSLRSTVACAWLGYSRCARNCWFSSTCKTVSWRFATAALASRFDSLYVCVNEILTSSYPLLLTRSILSEAKSKTSSASPASPSGIWFLHFSLSSAAYLRRLSLRSPEIWRAHPGLKKS